MRVNVARIWEDSDYAKVKAICESQKGWTEVYNRKGITVATQNLASSNFQMIKATARFPDVPPSLAFDVLHDSSYRPQWDKHMSAQKDIGLMNPNNDICYYALSSLPPIRPRDFVMQRSWLDCGDEKMICSHSVCHEDFPPNKVYIRGTVLLSGYLIKAEGDGCIINYISHSDPKGKLPTWLVNRVTKVVAPKVIKKLHKACLNYSHWKANNKPYWKPWIYHDQQIDLPRINMAQCEPREYEQEIIDESNAIVSSDGRADEDD